jgi:hypothetical protein
LIHTHGTFANFHFVSRLSFRFPFLFPLLHGLSITNDTILFTLSPFPSSIVMGTETLRLCLQLNL